MQTRNRKAAFAGIATIAVLATACGGSSSGGSGPTTPDKTGSGFSKLSPNNTGTPVTGGTLNVLSSSDTDYLDPNITYYSLGYSYVREFSRQLYSYAANPGHQTDIVADIATDMPEVSSDGLTYRITIKDGVQWNTSPARQVTAEDVVRGTKTTCNPYQPFGGLPNFNFLIKGMTKFCKGFGGVDQTASAIADYTENTDLPGVKADPKDPNTVIFTLTQPATFFVNQLALPAFSPRAKEMDDYIPASTQAAQHTVSDGPYQVDSYRTGKSITYTRNTAWKAETDPLRKAYVDKIVVDMTATNPESTQKQLQSNIEAADLAMNGVPATDVPALLAKNDPNINVESEVASNPYVLFNTVSPNNNKALANVKVRQALSYGLNRTHIIQVMAGPKISPPLTHVLPPQIEGSQDFDLYPNDTAKAQQLLTDANATDLKLKFLYRPSSPTSVKIFQTVQEDLKPLGIKVTGVEAEDADFYTKYLQNPDSARAGEWDVSLAGWGPDWYGNAALSFFGPLFDGRVLPPTSSDFGLFNDDKVNGLIDQAEKAKTEAESTDLWAQADRAVMEAAAFYPLSDPNEPMYHPNQTHNTIYMPQFQTFDFTNVWLDKNKQG